MPTAPDVQLYENAGRSVTMEPHQTLRHVPLAPHELTQRITPQSDLFVLAHTHASILKIGHSASPGLFAIVRRSHLIKFDNFLNAKFKLSINAPGTRRDLNCLHAELVMSCGAGWTLNLFWKRWVYCPRRAFYGRSGTITEILMVSAQVHM